MACSIGSAVDRSPQLMSRPRFAVGWSSWARPSRSVPRMSAIQWLGEHERDGATDLLKSWSGASARPATPRTGRRSPRRTARRSASRSRSARSSSSSSTARIRARWSRWRTRSRSGGFGRTEGCSRSVDAVVRRRPPRTPAVFGTSAQRVSSMRRRQPAARPRHRPRDRAGAAGRGGPRAATVRPRPRPARCRGHGPRGARAARTRKRAASLASGVASSSGRKPASWARSAGNRSRRLHDAERPADHGHVGDVVVALGAVERALPEPTVGGEEAVDLRDVDPGQQVGVVGGVAPAVGGDAHHTTVHGPHLGAGRLGLLDRPVGRAGEEVGGALEAAPGVAAEVGVLGHPGHRQGVEALQQHGPDAPDEHGGVGVHLPDRASVRRTTSGRRRRTPPRSGRDRPVLLPGSGWRRLSRRAGLPPTP